MEERGGKGNCLDARHTFMNFSGAVGRGLRRFFLICCSLVVLWFGGGIVFASVCL